MLSTEVLMEKFRPMKEMKPEILQGKRPVVVWKRQLRT